MYSDGSLQTVEIVGSEYQAAGAAVTKGPLPILVMGPQQSHRAKMYGVAIGTMIASNGDKEYIDKMATQLLVLDYDPIRPEDIAVCGSLLNVLHGWFVASFGGQGAAIGLLGGFIW